MAAPPARMPPLLLLLVSVGLGGAVLDLPPPTNIQYTIDDSICLLNVTWDPVETEHDCKIQYASVVTTGAEWVQKHWLHQNFRAVFIPLGKEVVFGVATSCNEEDGDYVNVTLSQTGVAGTGATNIQCLWYNMEYMNCSWQRGENASPDITYKLNYWYTELGRGGTCTNYIKEGDDFRCTFNTDVDWPKRLSISVQGNSNDIQPVCILNIPPEEYEFQIKPAPPVITVAKRVKKAMNLEWTKPAGYLDTCYQLNINGEVDPEIFRSRTKVTIPVRPKKQYTFRVRARVSTINCKYTPYPWSEWSEAVDVDEKDIPFSLLLYIILPLCVAVLTIIFLVYLKRIKMLILPAIPEPGKVLKQMFEEHIEDLQKPPPEEPIKDEQIHLLVFIKPSCNEN